MRAASLRRISVLGIVLAAGAQAAACGKSTAIGEVDTLVVLTANDSLWNSLEDTTRATLERKVYTVRPEQTFFLEQVDTAAAKVRQYLLFHQVIVFGTPDNRYVRQIADAVGAQARPDTILQAQDVWAHDQVATAVVLRRGQERASWTAQLARLDSLVDTEYRRFVHQRMYVSGEDTATERKFGEQYGFGLTFPRVYRVDTLTDSLIVIRNDNPDPADLIRSVTVTWGRKLDSLTAEAAFQWRDAIDSVYYHVPQGIDSTHSEVRRLAVHGRAALEATGAWHDEDTGYPAGGPFIDRLVQCPDRTYFLDAWVYAPGKSKYQYVLQVREILDSFTCGAGG